MSLYLLLDIGSLSVPFLFSFHPKIRFYKTFKAFLPALILSAGVYISWDIIFTQKEVWGFNATYLSGLSFLHLPIEEWLFFIAIPYACVFTYFTLNKIYPAIKLSKRVTTYTNYILVIMLLLLVFFNTDKAYTSVNALTSLIILASAIKWQFDTLQKFYIPFLILLIPFLIVNGVLTGSFIEGEVVWYNNLENLGIRIFTIPIEDIIYALGLILLNVFLTTLISRKILSQNI